MQQQKDNTSNTSQLVDAHDNFVNAATSRTNLVKQQIDIIKNHQSIIECLTAKKAQLLKIVKALPCHPMGKTNFINTVTNSSTGRVSVVPWIQCHKWPQQFNILLNKIWSQIQSNAQQHHQDNKGLENCSWHIPVESTNNLKINIIVKPIIWLQLC